MNPAASTTTLSRPFPDRQGIVGSNPTLRLATLLAAENHDCEYLHPERVIKDGPDRIIL